MIGHTKTGIMVPRQRHKQMCDTRKYLCIQFSFKFPYSIRLRLTLHFLCVPFKLFCLIFYFFLFKYLNGCEIRMKILEILFKFESVFN